MEGTPFRTIADLCQKKLSRSSDLPSLETRLLVFLIFDIQSVPFPSDLTASIPTQPAPVHIHVDIDVDLAVDIDRDIGGRDRLPQSRSGCDGR